MNRLEANDSYDNTHASEQQCEVRMHTVGSE